MCVCMCVSAYPSQVLTYVSGVALKTICAAYRGCVLEILLTCLWAGTSSLGLTKTFNTYCMIGSVCQIKKKLFKK